MGEADGDQERRRSLRLRAAPRQPLHPAVPSSDESQASGTLERKARDSLTCQTCWESKARTARFWARER